MTVKRRYNRPSFTQMRTWQWQGSQGGCPSEWRCRQQLGSAPHDVTAFYLQIWFQEDFANFWGACPWEEDLKVCREVSLNLHLHLNNICTSNLAEIAVWANASPSTPECSTATYIYNLQQIVES